jgi:hypothetical protein
MLSYRSAARPKPIPVCPYCQQKLGQVRYGIKWTATEIQILDILTDAPPDGLKARELAAIIIGDGDKWYRIRSHIYNIRAKLAETDWEIGRPMGQKFGRYMLRRRK